MGTARQLEANRRNGRLGGRPKGTGHLRKPDLARRWSKEVAREVARRKITEGLLPLIEAQMAHAQGIGHLYRRDKKGRYTRVEVQADIDAVLARGLRKDADGSTYWIFAKDPSVQAFTDLLNRALDKPTEHHAIVADVTLEERKRRLRTALARVRAPEEGTAER